MKKSWLLVALVFAAGCSGSPAAPPPPNVTSVTVTGADLLLIGKGETFSATGNTGGPVVVRWGSDAPSVALVDAAGRVSAVGTGTATIYADANGVRGTKLIRTLPDFAGTWTLHYRVVHCEVSGDIPAYPVCEVAPPNGMYLQLSQNGDGISGNFSLTDWYSYNYRNDNVSGAVSPDGFLSFTASSPASESLKIDNVRFQLGPGRRLSGTLEFVIDDWVPHLRSVRYSLELTPETR